MKRSLIRYSGLSALFLALPVICLNISGQTDPSSFQSQDSLKAASDHKGKHSLYAGAGYGSNMIWLGSTISGDMPYFSAALTYGFKNSLYISASASHLKGMDPFVAFGSLSSSYSHTFNKWFDISASLAGYKTQKDLQDTLFSDFGYVNFTAGFDWKILYTRLSLSSIVSDDVRGYIQISNSRYFQTGEFFNGNAFVSFNPEISMLSGEIIKIVVTATGIRKYGLSPPFRHYRKNPANTTETVTSQFGIMDFEFSLPVTFNYKSFSLEAEPCYIIPAHKNSQYPAPKGFSLYLSAYIKIF